MSDVPSAPTITCPGCGVAVAVGYPKCPRCHAAVPQPARAKRTTFRDQALAGGTSVEGEARSPWLWVALGVLGLVAAIGVAVVLSGGDDRPAPAAVDDADEDVADDEADDDAADEAAAEDDEGATPAATTTAPPADSGAAVRGLSEALRMGQLWAKVRRDGALVEVQSSLCEDAAMWPTIAAEAEELRGAGIATVQCIAPHGAVVFERGL